MLRPIAIHLPQYHPIPENDEWWGKGFTEWTNVTKAKPRFRGHYQPHLPTDLGFYDLRLSEAREAQAKLASEYGIYGFCYYHYWFNGRRILERPFQDIFESGKPDFPFMLCWANENWTRRWDGLDSHMLLKQVYSPEDDLNHIRTLIPYFKDARYIRINNKPVFCVYKSTEFTNIRNTIKIWREEAEKNNIELYICRFEVLKEGSEYLKDGFDAAVEFSPFTHKDEYEKFKNNFGLTGRLNQIINKLKKELIPKSYYESKDYNDFVNWKIQKPFPKYPRFPGIFPSWDNSARKKENALIFKNANPDKYGEWLEHIVKNFEPPSEQENLLFINAWNEWAEGNHLEPCRKWGRRYLENTLKALGSI